MRDPDLVVRAQRAAAELERAWDRWRTMHGLGADPLPAVSSYVGYSLQEPWGQPRVVFGIDAGEAEQLAALLNRHDCAGPVYASVASLAGARAGEAVDARADAERHLGAGRVRVPTQAHPLDPASEQEEDELELETARPQAQEPMPDHETVAPGDGEDTEGAPTDLPAFQPHADPAAYSGEDQEPEILDEVVQAAEPSPAPSGWTRASRVTRGHALPRQKRGGGAAKGAGSKQAG
jgi:hypothetical protein